MEEEDEWMIPTAPRKFRALLERERSQVTPPPEVRLTFAVCGLEAASCGWEGWILEDDNMTQACPDCARPLFRTDIAVIYSNPQEDEHEPEIEYEVVPFTYVEDPDRELVRRYVDLNFAPCNWIDETDHDHCGCCTRRVDTRSPHYSFAYINDEGAWLCPMCYARVARVS